MDRLDPHHAGLRDVARRRSAQVALSRVPAPPSFGAFSRRLLAELAAALAPGRRVPAAPRRRGGTVSVPPAH